MQCAGATSGERRHCDSTVICVQGGSTGDRNRERKSVTSSRAAKHISSSQVSLCTYVYVVRVCVMLFAQTGGQGSPGHSRQ